VVQILGISQLCAVISKRRFNVAEALSKPNHNPGHSDNSNPSREQTSFWGGTIRSESDITDVSRKKDGIATPFRQNPVIVMRAFCLLEMEMRRLVLFAKQQQDFVEEDTG
jgi:hypothetical protein